MCISCGDFVDICGQDECFNIDGGNYGRYRKFHIGDKYCRHLQILYGHDIAIGDDQDKENDE